jgi:hypothetical protein
VLALQAGCRHRAMAARPPAVFRWPRLRKVPRQVRKLGIGRVSEIGVSTPSERLVPREPRPICGPPIPQALTLEPGPLLGHASAMDPLPPPLAFFLLLFSVGSTGTGRRLPGSAACSRSTTARPRNPVGRVFAHDGLRAAMESNIEIMRYLVDALPSALATHAI